MLQNQFHCIASFCGQRFKKVGLTYCAVHEKSFQGASYKLLFAGELLRKKEEKLRNSNKSAFKSCRKSYISSLIILVGLFLSSSPQAVGCRPAYRQLIIMTSFTKNIIFLALSTFVGFLLMWWIYRGFNVRQLLDFFSQRSNYLWITLVLVTGVIANVLRSLRWRMLLSSAGIRISVRRSIELVFISYLINSVTPRLGELTRSLLVKRGDSEVSTRALGTVVIEKLADVVCLLVLIGLAVSLRWQQTVGLVQRFTDGLTWALPSYTFYIIIGCAVCLLVGISFPLWKHIRRFIRNLWQGVTAIARLRSPLSFVMLCVAIWVCNFLQLYLLFPCFETLETLSLADGIHLFAAASVGVLLPTPAGAGPWHFAIVKTLTSVYHIAKPIAQSCALISHGLKTLLVMLLGVIGYASYFRSVWAWWRRKRR